MNKSIIFLFLFFSISIYGQVTVIENQYVGLGEANPSEKLEVNGNILASALGVDGPVERVFSPGGASYGGPSSITGAIKITLPVSWTNTMMQFTVKVFDYSSQESFNIHISGYNRATDEKWQSPSAWIESSPLVNRNFPVRFGYENSKCCVYIGDVSSVWRHLKVSVIDFEGSYISKIEDWLTGWNINVVSSLASQIDYTVESTQVNNWGRNENDVYWSSGSGNVGIGTNVPNSKLEVKGDTKIVGNASIFNGGSSTILNGTGSTNAGRNSIYIGAGSGSQQSSAANYNVAIGRTAMRNSSGDDNVAIGRNALLNSTTGNSNIALGRSAGLSTTTAKNCVYIGTSAGYYNNTDNRLYISGDGTHTTPLIYGQFDNRYLRVGGTLKVGFISENNSNIGAVLALQPRPSAPNTPENGMIYYGTDHKVHVYSNGQWKTLKFE